MIYTNCRLSTKRGGFYVLVMSTFTFLRLSTFIFLKLEILGIGCDLLLKRN